MSRISDLRDKLKTLSSYYENDGINSDSVDKFLNNDLKPCIIQLNTIEYEDTSLRTQIRELENNLLNAQELLLAGPTAISCPDHIPRPQGKYWLRGQENFSQS